MKVLALVTILVVLGAAISHAEDLGIPDTARVEGDTLRIGMSLPINLHITNDYPLQTFNFGFMSNTIDGGFAIIDSVKFVGRLADPQVLDFRIVSFASRDGVSPDTTKMYAHSNNMLPAGSGPVLQFYMTGIEPGEMVIDSGFFPPVGTFIVTPEGFPNFVHFTPQFATQTITIIEAGLPPVLEMPLDDPRVEAGVEVIFDVYAESPEGYPVQIELLDFSPLEAGAGTPTNAPTLIGDNPVQFSWQTTSSDIGLWSATIRSCDTAGMCASQEAIVQVVTDESFLLSFSQTETQDAPEAFHLALGNCDEDIVPELFVCSKGLNYPVTACLLDLTEDMTFDTAWTFPNSYSLRGPVAGYLNDDANIDFVMLGSTTECAYIMLGDGNTGFTTEVDCSQYNTYAHGAVLGEFTGDQYLDYVVVNNSGIGLFRGGADPVLAGQDIPISLGGEVPKSVTSADFDDDGLDDLAVGTENGLRIYLSDGVGGFDLYSSYSQTYGSLDIEVTNQGSDFNNDDQFDLCLATPSLGGTHSELVVYLGNGDGSFSQTVIRTPLGHVMANCTGDFNNDGNLDIAYVNGSEHYCAILFGDGDGYFTNELRYDIDRYSPIQVISFDADADADLDIVVASYEIQTGASLFVLENQLDPEGFSAMQVLITAEDNAELSLTSPSGQVVNKVRSSIASGEYQRRNSNQNSLLDDAISFNTVEAGVYTISASPKPATVKSVETFSLEIVFGATSYRFADNSAMDPAGYEFHLYPSGGSPVSPPPGTWVYDASPQLSWAGSGTFDVQVATDIEFANVVEAITVGGNSYEVSPLDTSVADLYYWRVKPVAQPEYETVYPFNLSLVDCIRRGNVDHDPAGMIDISDMVYLVDFMFVGGPPSPNSDEANVDGMGGTDISDLVYLVDYMFTGGPEPPACP